MKYFTLLFTVCLVGLLLTGCLQENMVELETAGSDSQARVDPDTPHAAQPLIKQASTPTGAAAAPPPGTSWNLVWSDEFNGRTIDSSKWDITVSSKSRKARPNIGVRDWWWRKDHAFLDGDGRLILRASKVDSDTMHTGSVDSNSLFETKYGYFETRIKVADTSKGNHTAFWFTGDNQGNVDGTANDGAEIDVFESAWVGDFTKSVLHIDGYGKDHQANTKRYETPGIHDGYHTFGMHWTAEFIKIYYDGELKVTYSERKWRVLVPEFIWLSVGASFGDGDFRSQPVGVLSDAKVDYVRVWKSDGSGDGNGGDDGGFDPSVDAFRFVNKQTGKGLRTLGTEDDAQIIQAGPNHTGGWTHWTVQPTTGKYVYFVNAPSGKYFRPTTDERGSSLQLKPTAYGGSWTQWEMINTGDGDGSVYIKNKETGQYIRPQTSANNSDIVLTSSFNAGDWQRWILEPVN